MRALQVSHSLLEALQLHVALRTAHVHLDVFAVLCAGMCECVNVCERERQIIGECSHTPTRTCTLSHPLSWMAVSQSLMAGVH